MDMKPGRNSPQKRGPRQLGGCLYRREYYHRSLWPASLYCRIDWNIKLRISSLASVDRVNGNAKHRVENEFGNVRAVRYECITK